MTNLLNVIWPAIYVSETFWKFWYLIVGTVFIEFFVLRFSLRFSWKKSFLASLVGNLASGLIGTFIMKFGMLGWHVIADIFLQGTFAKVNWIATYLLMCLGSVLIETKTVSLIYNEKWKRLFFPMLTGNLLTYVFIAFAMTASAKKDEHVKTERITYLSEKVKFSLVDSTNLIIDTAFIEIWYNSDNERIDYIKPKYRLQVPFHKNNPDNYTVAFSLLTGGSSSGIHDNKQQLIVEDIKEEYYLILEQKNPDSTIGWEAPIYSDTFAIKRMKKQ